MKRFQPGLLALAGALVLAPLILPGKFHLDMATKVCINALVCVGLNLLMGYAGQISLGHAGFFALGAYTSAILTSNYGLPSLLALGLGALGVALLAFLVGRPILRLRGNYLAMATLGLGLIIHIVINREIALTGGPDGMSVPAFALGSWRLVHPVLWYALVAGALLLTVWGAQRLMESPAGLALKALDGSERAAEAAGVDVAACKLRVFILSAVLAAVAGSLYAHTDRFVTPQEAGFMRSIEMVTMVVLGGMASTFGAVLGAAILTVLPQSLTIFQDHHQVAFGVLLVSMMVLAPRGLAPLFAGLLARRRT